MLNSVSKSIYLDACATTPILPVVLEYINHIENNNWANPSSLHSYGLKACEIIERSRNNINKKLNVGSGNVIFTSGATESIRLALLHASNTVSKGRIVTSSIEHSSVYQAVSYLRNSGWSSEIWPVDHNGIIRLELIDKYLSPPTKILSIVWGQGEIGSVQPISYIANECRKRNIILHTDASQVISQGLIDFKSLNVDYLSFSAHKFGGPKGVGALLQSYNTKEIKLPNSNETNISQFQLRPGTQPTSLIGGMSLAIDNLNTKIKANGFNTIFDNDKTAKLTRRLKLDLTKVKSIMLTGHPTKRLPHHLSYVICQNEDQNVQGRNIVRLMSERGIMISSGAACNSNKLDQDNTLKSLGIQQKLRQSAIRFSLGSWISEQDIDNVPNILLKLLNE